MEVTKGRGQKTRQKTRQRRRGGPSVVLLVAVPHADALQAVPGLDGRRGLLARQPRVDGLVALVVQRGVQDALQPEVTVRLL